VGQPILLLAAGLFQELLQVTTLIPQELSGDPLLLLQFLGSEQGFHGGHKAVQRFFERQNMVFQEVWLLQGGNLLGGAVAAGG